RGYGADIAHRVARRGATLHHTCAGGPRPARARGGGVAVLVTPGRRPCQAVDTRPDAGAVARYGGRAAEAADRVADRRTWARTAAGRPDAGRARVRGAGHS